MESQYLSYHKKSMNSGRVPSMRLRIDNYLDNAKEFYEKNPYFYDKQGLFWFWSKKEYKYKIMDDVDLMRLFDKIIGFEGQTITSNLKRNYLEAFKRVGREYHPQPAKEKWIQFKNKAYDLNGHFHDVNYMYFFTNPIPHEIGQESETPIMDKLFAEWVGVDYVETLYEIIAYCCYTRYPVQVLFCLYGNGRNGKSCFLRLLQRFIGLDNLCTTELDLITGMNSSRFETFKLYKKLVCIMGETNFGTLNKSSILKKLTGGDMIGFEVKGKQPFDDYNYAKMIIASNSLPTSEDTSEGFYRRWVIIDFPNQFKEGKDILESIPKQEYSNLAKKVTQILPKLLENGKFTNQGSISERRNKYILASNPVPLFVDEYCDKNEDFFCSLSELYTIYVQYLKKMKKRRVKLKEFKAALEDEGYWIERTTKKVDEEFKTGNWIMGIRLKEIMQHMPIIQDSPLSSRKEYKGVRNVELKAQPAQKNIQEELVVDRNTILEWKDTLIVYHKCNVENCNECECNFDSYGIPYCRKHWDLMAR